MNLNHAQIPQNLFDESTAKICLDLIARHAPRLMREGGGPLIRRKRLTISEEERKNVIELYTRKEPRRMTWLEIEDEVDRPKSIIRKILREAGLLCRRHRSPLPAPENPSHSPMIAAA